MNRDSGKRMVTDALEQQKQFAIDLNIVINSTSAVVPKYVGCDAILTDSGIYLQLTKLKIPPSAYVKVKLELNHGRTHVGEAEFVLKSLPTNE